MIPGIMPAIRKKAGGGDDVFYCNLTAGASGGVVGYSSRVSLYGSIDRQPIPNVDFYMLYTDGVRIVGYGESTEFPSHLSGKGLWVDGVNIMPPLPDGQWLWSGGFEIYYNTSFEFTNGLTYLIEFK